MSAGELGQITMAHSEFCFNAVDFEGADNPMFDAKLAGGGALPVGCYVAQASVRDPAERILQCTILTILVSTSSRGSSSKNGVQHLGRSFR